MKTLLRPAVSLFVLLTAVTGMVYPLAVTGARQGHLSRSCRRQPDRQGWQGSRLPPDRPELQRPQVFLGPPLGNLAAAIQRQRFQRLQPGTAQSGPGRCRQGADRGFESGRPRQQAANPGRSGQCLGQRPRSAHQPGSSSLSGGSRCQPAPSAAGRRQGFGQPAHRRPPMGRLRRTPGKRPATQHRA